MASMRNLLCREACCLTGPKCLISIPLKFSSHSFSSNLLHCNSNKHKFICLASNGDISGNPSGESYGIGTSYLSMWKRAMKREEERRKQRSVDSTQNPENNNVSREENKEKLEENFFRILEVSEEERRKKINEQVIDRAGAALSAAKSFFSDLNIQIEDDKPSSSSSFSSVSSPFQKSQELPTRFFEKEFPGLDDNGFYIPEAASKVLTSPGPDFWSWRPPPKNGTMDPELEGASKPKSKSRPSGLAFKERIKNLSELTLPLESQLENDTSSEDGENNSMWNMFQSRASPALPPLQSFLDMSQEVTVSGLDAKVSTQEKSFSIEEHGIQSSVSEDMEAYEFHESVHKSADKLGEGGAESGENSDGSRWWKEWGVEHRPGGEVCEWTVLRGVSSEGMTEWQEKWWEIRDEERDYTELGAEKSGRDVSGNIWRETWREAMWMDEETSLTHLEKSADKWGMNGKGGEWHEKWFEHYDAFGRVNKWADKWCKIDPYTPIDPGHAHVWHEKWGEEYNGSGKVFKYTDKWAERFMGDGRWSRWGDKWNEEFDKGHGKKYGETWSESKEGERWNRTWGEEYTGFGHVHKYGHSSSGEHWDTHEVTDFIYPSTPHYGFKECFDHSVRLRNVARKGRKGSL